MSISVVCRTLKQRIQFDKKHGKTTSEAAKDFVRRTCKCEACVAWRRGQISPRVQLNSRCTMSRSKPHRNLSRPSAAKQRHLREIRAEVPPRDQARSPARDRASAASEAELAHHFSGAEAPTSPSSAGGGGSAASTTFDFTPKRDTMRVWV